MKKLFVVPLAALALAVSCSDSSLGPAESVAPRPMFDDIPNNLDLSVDADAEVMNLVVGGANGTTQLRVVETNGDGKNGCNLTGHTTLVVSVSSSNPAVATVSPSSITFDSCAATATLTVTPVAVGSTTISLSQTSNSTEGTFNLAPATFRVDVAASTANNSPTADPGGPYTGAEGASIELTGTGSTDTDGVINSYEWTYSVTSADVGAACVITNGDQAVASIVCNDDGTYAIKLKVTDDDGAADEETTTLTLSNVAPVVVIDPESRTINEGGTASYTATATDQGTNDGVASFAWSTTVGACTLQSGSTAAAATFSCNDNGTGTVRLEVTDDDAGTGSDEASLTVDNVAPVINTPLTLPASPVAVGTNNVVMNWSFTDPGSDSWTCTIKWDSSDSFVSATYVATKSCTDSESLPAGVYTVTVKVTDDDGGAGEATATSYIVVYDPNGGFVTGGGWIDSPAGAYAADPLLSGRANFGFVSKYLKGSTTPTGNTEFQFHAGSLDFKSSSYEWLVVSGTKAQYKGSGSINGVSGYGFLLTAIDGGNTGDRFRIKIWNRSTGDVVYDNQMGELEDSSAATGLSGGSIIVHTRK